MVVDRPEFTEDISPEEFAAQWGCDPCYCQPPCLPGDGYLFYNFSVEQDDPKFLREFIPAIQRMMQFATEADDKADLQVFLDYVKALLQEKIENGNA